MKPINILISDAAIFSAPNEPIRRGGIGIENDRIAFIGNVPESFIPNKTIQAGGSLAMPGLINAHTHSAMSLLRNYADDIPFWEWLTEKVWPVEAKMGADAVYWGSLLSIAELIRSGVTAFADMYFFSEETARAAAESGIRCSVAKGLVGSSKQDQQRFRDTRQLYRDWHLAANGLITVMAGPHAPYTCDDSFMMKVVDLCAELDIPIHIHLSESRKEVEDSVARHGHSPIQHMNRLGVFRHHTLAAHCVHLLPDDFKILSENNVNVVHNPASNLKLGNGIAPVAQMLSSGINVSLGTDGSSSNNNLNLFEEMNLTALLAKGTTQDPTVVPVREVLAMATINGARALNLHSQTGELKPGKKADVILIDLEKPHLYPHYRLESLLVYSAQASDVRTVIVNGQIVMEEGELTTIDLEKTYDQIRRITKKIVG